MRFTKQTLIGWAALVVVAMVALAAIFFFATRSSVDDTLAKGEELFNNGAYDEAIKVYEGKLRWEQDDPRLLSEVIKTYAQQGNRTGTEDKAVERASKHITKAESIAEGNRDVLLALGYMAEVSGDYGKAITYYQQATEKDPSFAQSWFHLGHAYEFLGELDKAQELYEQAYKLDPDNVQALMAKGREAWRVEEYDEAVDLFGEAAVKTESKPLKAEAFTAIANIYHQQGRYLEARDVASLAVITDDSYALALVTYGMSLSYEGRAQDAVGYIEAAMQQNPRMVSPVRAMATVLRVAGQYNVAIGLFAQGLEMVDNDNTIIGTEAKTRAKASLAYELAKTRSMAGQTDQVLDLLEYATNLDASIANVVETDVENGFFQDIREDDRFQALLS